MRTVNLVLLAPLFVACAGQRGEAAQALECDPVSGPGVIADASARAKLWPRFFVALEGKFVATTSSGAEITVTRRSVSNNSAHIESFVTPSGAETITMVHPDGDTILMTHYCGQGNQAVLVVESATEDRIVFTGVRATNVTEEQGVLSRLELNLLPDGYEHKETYTAGGEVDTTTLHFVRL